MSVVTSVPARSPLASLRRRVLGTVAGALILIALVYAVRGFVSIDTNLLWFRAVGHESTYTRIFWTKALLFVLFGVLMAAALANNLVWLYRARPEQKPDPVEQRWRHLYFRIEPRIKKGLLLVIVVYAFVSMGGRAAGGWQTWLAWRNAVHTGTHDAYFHRDISYFLFVYPLHRMVLTFLFRIVATTLVTVLAVGYWYGAIVLRGPKRGMTKAMQTQVSVLLGLYLVLKVFGYWLDRYGFATSNTGVVTGPSYTDTHVAIPGKLILVVIAAISAVLMLANARLLKRRLFIGSLGLLAIGAFVFGVAIPKLVYQFRDKPSASQLEQKYIGHNLVATRAAFGLNAITPTTFEPASTPSIPKGEIEGTDDTQPSLLEQVTSNDQIRLLDPQRLSPTYTANQQLKSYYTFKNTLDVDRYLINGKVQDVTVAVRELNTSGLPSSKSSWTNSHIVYTHGYGIVAAPTDTTSTDGTPAYAEKGIPASPNALGVTVPQVYYGQVSNSYSIVGGPAGSKPREFDHPSANGSGESLTTHLGGGGVPLGTVWHRLLYAVKLKTTSLLFSSEINKDSQLIYNTNPRARVAAVAPWLTLDGDTYPVVVNGQIDWIVDGYTTSNNYPYSQQINLRSATSTTYTSQGSSVTQPSTSINYMRNSVKAVVNGYTGKVTLYAWSEGQTTPDPILQTWEKAFPGLIQPQSAIPAALSGHLRYPTDLFNVQRSLIAQYHVTSPVDFYSGSDFWKVPTDPTANATTSTNSVGTKVTNSLPNQPSTYMTLSQNGESNGVFALSSGLATLNRVNLAAYLSVDSEPGPDYGKFTLLELPSSPTVAAPLQTQNDIEADPAVIKALSLARTGGQVQVVLGNLLAVPLDGQILYVEPIYTQTTGTSAFPTLSYVAAVYNGKVGFGESLDVALTKAFAPAAVAATP